MFLLCQASESFLSCSSEPYKGILPISSLFHSSEIAGAERRPCSLLRLQSYALKQGLPSFRKAQNLKIVLVGEICRTCLRPLVSGWGQSRLAAARVSFPAEGGSGAGSWLQGCGVPLKLCACDSGILHSWQPSSTGAGPLFWQPVWDPADQDPSFCLRKLVI